ncbi:apolipoprotein N-acyltransferase [Vallicoccus soli]|uniref:Apolipoprotein N-acyltransferase n=1 Tax=Vallicoccus soli TaxID=2339232 RepID=A0A3A3ZDS3_9ACTN|nr:apolipoprotein N-acyltransferase [Vallicoccus soli]
MRLLAAAGTGAALTLAFPPYDLWWVASLCVAALALLTRGATPRRGALLGLLAGLGFFVPLLHWSGVYVGPVPWLVLAAVQALYLVPLGAASALVQRLPAWPLWVAALWVGQEALRTRWPYGGFPWGRLAFSQADAPTLGLAAAGGAPLVTAAVALAGALLAAAVLALRGARPARGAAAGAGALAAVLAGLAVPVLQPAPADGPTVRVALVQGGVPRLGLDFNAQRQAVLRNHVDATRRLAADVRAGRVPAPDLVVWPENASDVDPFRDPSAAALISGAVDDVGVPVLVGTLVGAGPDHVENTGVVWTPGEGPGERYVKQHPVPFAEYIPLREVARVFSDDVDRVGRDMVAGDRTGVLQVGPATVADVICFETGYDGLVRDAVAGGGQVVVVQTNNATFGRTPQTEQQLVMTRLRAVEHARTGLVVATSGVSAVIAPDGAVLDRAEVFTAETLHAEVPLSSTLTLATRAGAWPELALTLAGLAALAAAAAPALPVLPALAARRARGRR